MKRKDIITYLSENKSMFRRRFHIQALALFGSYARDEQTDTSDIDIAYECVPDESMGLSDYMAFKQALEKAFGCVVEIVNMKYMNPVVRYTARKDMVYV